MLILTEKCVNDILNAFVKTTVVSVRDSVFYKSSVA